MWVSNPGLPGIVKSIPDQAFYGGWDQFGWVVAVAPVTAGGFQNDAGQAVSKAELGGFVTEAVASAIGTELPGPIAAAIEVFREEAMNTYAHLDTVNVGLDTDGVPYFADGIPFASAVPLHTDTDGVPYLAN